MMDNKRILRNKKSQQKIKLTSLSKHDIIKFGLFTPIFQFSIPLFLN